MNQKIKQLLVLFLDQVQLLVQLVELFDFGFEEWLELVELLVEVLEILVELVGFEWFVELLGVEVVFVLFLLLEALTQILKR